MLDEKPEVDDGYVTLTDAVVNADGTITESNKRTGTWAWKHYQRQKVRQIIDSLQAMLYLSMWTLVTTG